MTKLIEVKKPKDKRISMRIHSLAYQKLIKKQKEYIRVRKVSNCSISSIINDLITTYL
jgi:hypothetical protein